MTAVLPCRVAVAGAELRMLVLAADGGGCVGVDLESGAFVRATYHGDDGPLSAFDVVSGQIATSAAPPDVSRPETVVLERPPRCQGRLTPRRAERWLLPLQHPRGRHLLDLAGPAAPYWTLAGDRPSVTLVEMVAGPQVRREPLGFDCRFGWRGTNLALPLADRRLGARLREVGWPRYSSRDLEQLLGHRVRRLLVVLSPPHNGYCYKVVAALLPGG
ncbi:MAG: hypothetical protein ACR2HY_09590 [Acidimicrobiales bacterium]